MRTSAAMLLAVLRAITQCREGWSCGVSLCMLRGCGLAALRFIGNRQSETTITGGQGGST